MSVSPLRYPGGKAKLFKVVSQIIAKNGLFEHTYCEPYAGGAGLALKLLTTGFTNRVVLNDLDYSIYAFWRSVLDHADDLCELIECTEVNVKEWRKQKEIRQTAADRSMLELGFSTFFLNRTSRSGILDGSGPIGGFKQSGKWKIDARYNKAALIGKIKTIAKFGDRISFENKDAKDFLLEKMPDNKIFFNLDPPYYVKGYKLYRNHYKALDHSVIRDILRKNNKKTWILTYDNVGEIRDLYSGFQQVAYDLQYSAGTSSVGSELFIASAGIDVSIDGLPQPVG